VNYCKQYLFESHLLQEAENARLEVSLKDAEMRCQRKCDELREQWRAEKEELERRCQELIARNRFLVSESPL